LVVEIAGASIPSVMDFAVAGKRGVKTNDARYSSLFEPRHQFVTAPDAQPAEIEYLELAPATLA
jgi:hypothetical protein